MSFKKLLFTIIISGLMCIKVYAEETNYIGSWRYDEGNHLEYYMKEIIFVSQFTEQEKRMLIFDNFFNRCDNEVNFVPEDTELLDVKLYDGHLELYVSEAIRDYGGGTAWEIALVEGILSTAFTLDDVEDVTLYIDGKVEYLPEGTILDRYRKEDYICRKLREEVMTNYGL